MSAAPYAQGYVWRRGAVETAQRLLLLVVTSGVLTACTDHGASGPARLASPADRGSSQPVAPQTCADAGAALVAAAEWPSAAVPVMAPDDTALAPVAARSVFDFVTSVGVNVHATYNDTPYSDHDRIIRALRDLHISHVRDGLVAQRDDQRRFLLDLASQGICTDLIVGHADLDRAGLTTALDEAVAMSPALELLEGPNEADLTVGTDWPTLVEDQQTQLVDGIAARAELRPLPLVQPSFGRLDALEDSAALSLPGDLDNLHPYPGGGPPSQHLLANLQASGQATAQDPIVATEHGYHNAVEASEGHPGVPEEVAAVYVPRVFLESFAAGIDRTYLYELIDQFDDPEDDDPESQFGLLRTDFSEKPAATALRNTLTVLDAEHARPHTAEPLAVKIGTDTDDVRGLLLQEANATWWLAVWRQVGVYDVDSGTPSEVTPAPATITVDRPVDAEVHRPMTSPSAVQRIHAEDAVAVDVPADALLIALRATED